jgi:phosphoglycolate phosphatase-like HAD superfamily hydrolase
MSGFADPKNIVLRPWLAPKKEQLDKVSALSQLAQLSQEQNLFTRHITEERFEQEIKTGKHASEEVMEGVEGEEKQQDAPTYEKRQQELVKARQEILDSVLYVGPTTPCSPRY